MPHEVYKERFISARKPAWHGLGLHFLEPISPTEAVAVAGFSEPREVPLEVEGRPTDYKAIVSEDGEVFGVVSKRWRMIRLGDVLDVLEDMAKHLPLSAAGQLRGGRYTFFTFEQEGEILGEAYLKHIVVLHSYEPGKAWKVMYTPTRVVCMNTLIASERDAEFSVSVHHVGRAEEKARGAAIYALAEARARVVDQKLEALAKVGDFDAQIDALLDYVWPLEEAPDFSRIRSEEERVAVLKNYESRMEYRAMSREAAYEAYLRFNDEHPRLAQTAYAGLQAVVEAADWRVGKRSVRDVVRHNEVRVLGSRAKEKARAWEFATSLI